MKVLLCSATLLEIQPLLIKFGFDFDIHCNTCNFKIDNIDLRIAITGIGGVFTTYNLLKNVQNEKFDFVINAGICGSYSSDIKPGDTLITQNACFGDLGFEDGIGFTPLIGSVFFEDSKFPFERSKLHNSIAKKYADILNLYAVNVISVNRTITTKKHVSEMIELFEAQIETMESAAVYFVCLSEKIPFLEIRSCSNYVAPRLHAEWNVSLAVNNLSETLYYFLKNNLII